MAAPSYGAVPGLALSSRSSGSTMGESIAPFVAEFVGTFLLVFAVGVCSFTSSAVWLPTAIAATYATVIYIFGSVSGGHFNPSVSIACGLAKQVAWSKVWGYVCMQVAGAALGGYTYFDALGQAVPVNGPSDYDWTQAAFVEIFYTTMLCLVALHCAVSTGSSGPGDEPDSLALAVGFVLVAGGYAAGNISGALFNPAVTLGLDLLGHADAAGSGGRWKTLFLASQLLGSLLAALLFSMSRQGAAAGGAPVDDGSQGCTLQLRVHRAYNLRSTDSGVLGDTSDPYVNVRVGLTQYRTPTIINDMSPTWTSDNEFVFNLLPHGPSQLWLEVRNNSAALKAATRYAIDDPVEIWIQSQREWMPGRVADVGHGQVLAGGHVLRPGWYLVEFRNPITGGWQNTFVEPSDVDKVLRRSASSPQAAAQAPFAAGDRVEIWSQSEQTWLAGRVADVGSGQVLSTGQTLEPGWYLIEFRSPSTDGLQHSFIEPASVGEVLRRTCALAQDQSLGACSVDILDLPLGEWEQKQEMLDDDRGGELVFELRRDPLPPPTVTVISGVAAEPSFSAKLVCEFLGTFAFVFTFGLNIVTKSPATAWSAAAAYICALYCRGCTSGGFYNPAVTLALVLSRRGKCSPTLGMAYWIVQLAAGALAGLLYSWFHAFGPFKDEVFGLAPGASVLADGTTYSWTKCLGTEFVATFMLAYVILAVAATSQSSAVLGVVVPLGSSRRNFQVALAGGGCVFAGSLAASAVSGGEMNPALCFGLSTGSWAYHGNLPPPLWSNALGFSAAELAASVLAAFMFFLTHTAEYLRSDAFKS